MTTIPQLTGIPTTLGDATLNTELLALKAEVATLKDKPAFDPKSLQDAIAQLQANETVDDATVAALDALVKAIPVSPDLSKYALKTDIPSAVTAYDDTALRGLIPGDRTVVFRAAQSWPTDLKPNSAVHYLSESGNVQQLIINDLPSTLTAIWIAGRKQALANSNSVTIKDVRRATARILDNVLIIETDYKEANLIWNQQTSAATVYPLPVPGVPNMREALRRWKFRVLFTLAAQTTAAQFLADAQTNPLSNYAGPNGVAITTEPTLDTLRLTPFGGTEVYSTVQVDAARVIPAGVYVSWIVGVELYLIQLSAIAPDLSWLLDTSWKVTGETPAEKYTRSLKASQSTLTKIEFEYDQVAPKTYSINAPFTAGASVTTGFKNHGYWNVDAAGTTYMPSVGTDRLVIALNNDNRIITLAVQDTTKPNTDPAYYKKIRNVKFNGIPCDLNL